MLTCLHAGPAAASKNVSPSKAIGIKLGTPFIGTWAGTPYSVSDDATHWWKLPAVVRAGDTLQLAVDARQSDFSVQLCLVPPVDDFGAADAFSDCYYAPFVDYGSQDRLQLTYEGPSGLAYLVASGGCCLDPGDTVSTGFGQYSATLERIVTLVNIGLTIPPSLPSSFALDANLVYGDNTPAADGIPAFLQWRFVAPRGSDPGPFSNLIEATSVGGAVTFAGTVPIRAQGRKISLRACVVQPGGTTLNCAEATRTSVVASPCARALASRRSKARSVRRLTKRLRHARGAKKRLIRRKLRKQKRRLARAKRSVRIHCA